MWKFKKLFFYTFLVSLHLVSSGGQTFADGFLKKSDLEDVKTICKIENYEVVFCSSAQLEGNVIIVNLSSINSILLANGSHAFRVSATLENLSKRVVLNSKVKVSFGNEPEEALTVILPEKVIYKASSTSKLSHLVRSDIKSMRRLYEKINFAYYNADTSGISLEIAEINFITN
jgi:hypothetical protein